MLNAAQVSYRKRLESIPFKNKMDTRIIRFFPDTNMNNGHDGLTRLALKHDLDLKEIGWGEYVIFLNKKKTILKLFSAGNLIAHLKMPEGASIDLDIIRWIPRFFNGSIINYSGALQKTLEEKLGR